MLEYLVDGLRSFWTRHDFKNFLHFISHNRRHWQFGLQIVMHSKISYDWFFGKSEQNKADLLYRIHREINLRQIDKQMEQELYSQLSRRPFAACFFTSMCNHAYVEKTVPSLDPLRACLSNIKDIDLMQIHSHLHEQQALKNDIMSRFSEVHSYIAVVQRFNELIDLYLLRQKERLRLVDQAVKAVEKDSIS